MYYFQLISTPCSMLDEWQPLPVGCVLERIYSIQTLDDLDIERVYPLYRRLKGRMAEDPSLR